MTDSRASNEHTNGVGDRFGGAAMQAQPLSFGSASTGAGPASGATAPVLELPLSAPSVSATLGHMAGHIAPVVVSAGQSSGWSSHR
jgi:hypothetical protein